MLEGDRNLAAGSGPSHTTFHVRQLSGRIHSRSDTARLKSREEAWKNLQKQLGPALRADDSEFVAVSAEDVIRRNKRR